MAKVKRNKYPTLQERWSSERREPGEGIEIFDDITKDSVNRKEMLMSLSGELQSVLGEIEKRRGGKPVEKQIVKPTVKPVDVMFADALPDNVDTGGMPSEVRGYEGLTYEEVIRKALEAEKEAIFLGLYAIELAPDKDIKELVEITNDENDHSAIYERVLKRLTGS